MSRKHTPEEAIEAKIRNKEKKREYAAARREKIKEYLHAYYLAHKEKAIADAKAWDLANPEKKKASSLKSAIKNREKKNFKERQKYAADPAKAAEVAKRRYARNKEAITAYNIAWRKANPEKAANMSRVRRGLKNGGRFTAEEFTVLKDLYNNICLACKRDDVKLTADHVIPLSKGGSNDISNIQPLCKSCNSKKATKIIDYRLDTQFNQAAA